MQRKELLWKYGRRSRRQTEESDNHRVVRFPPHTLKALYDEKDMKNEIQNGLQIEAAEITSKRIISCPSCNSPKFTYYDLRKRGWYLILTTIILAPIFFYLIPGGVLVATGCILIVGSKGIHLVLKGGSYYICQDCLLWIDENGNKLGK